MIQKLSDDQRRVANEIAGGTQLTVISKEQNISLYRIDQWRRDPVSKAYLESVKEAGMEKRLIQFSNLSDLAVETLREILTNGKQESAKIKAVQLIMDAVTTLSNISNRNKARVLGAKPTTEVHKLDPKAVESLHNQVEKIIESDNKTFLFEKKVN